MKEIAGVILTLFLIAAFFSAVPVKPQFVGTIKIGTIGPMPWIQGNGIAEGAKLAAKQINYAGGIVTAGGAWKVEVITADTLRGFPVTIPENGGAMAAMELVAAGVDFAIGGFITEAVYGAREVFMDSVIGYDKPIFFIAGAATNELIDCGTGTCGACVRCDYDRYRFVFRAAPMNSTMSFNGIADYLKYVMTEKLAPIYTGYATPLKIAVISEDLPSADVMHTNLTSETFWNTEMNMSPYGGVSVVYRARVSPVATDVSSELLSAQAAGAKLIVHVLSGSVGRTMATQWHDLGIKALLSGIDVAGQEIPLHWTATAGKCEYESFLSTAGTLPFIIEHMICPQMTAFWEAYVDEYGYAPIYTSYGAYDAVMMIKETIEEVGRWPMGAGEMVPHIEKTYRPLGMPVTLGTFKYTGPHPMSPATYNATWTNGTHGALDVNPTMMGTLHDVFMRPEDLGAVWYPPYYTRPLVCQWQKHPITGEGRLEIVYPINMPYSKKIRIPPWMYSHADTDIASLDPITSEIVCRPDGCVDALDMDAACIAWLSTPGDPAWVAGGQYYGLEADQDSNGVINIADVSVIAKEYGYDAIIEYGKWPLGDP